MTTSQTPGMGNGKAFITSVVAFKVRCGGWGMRTLRPPRRVDNVDEGRGDV
jgi:hypothetical protein